MGLDNFDRENTRRTPADLRERLKERNFDVSRAENIFERFNNKIVNEIQISI